MEQPKQSSIAQYLRRWATPITVFLVTRGGLFLLAYFSLIYLPMNTAPDAFTVRSYPNNLFLDGWTRWDAIWYENIATEGYSLTPPFGDIREVNVQRNPGFLPMYPLLMSIVGTVFGDVMLAGILISNLAFLGALILLYELVKNRFGENRARTTVIMISIFPFSFYFSAVYTESIFLLSVLWAFYFGERKQWVLAVFGAAVAGATRVVGVFTVIALIVMYLEQINFDRQKIRANILWIPLGVLGLVSYMVFLWVKLGSPFLFIDVQGDWGGPKINRLIHLVSSLFVPQTAAEGQFQYVDAFHVFFTVVVVGLTIITWKRLPKSYATWTTLVVLFTTFTRWIGMGRYGASTFTLFILATLVLPEKWHGTLSYLSILFLALFTILFTHWYWVA